MAQQSESVTAAISRLLMKQPFYAVLLMDLLEIKETPSVKTAATDGKYLYINTEFFENKCKNDNERIFVIAHEVLHVVMRHCPRLKMYAERGFGPDMQEFSRNKWNRATDYIINDTLYQDKVGSMPEWVLHHPDYDYEQLADDVYLKLDDDDDEDSFDEHMEADDADMPTEGDVQRAVASAAQAAKAQGDIPGCMKRLVGEMLEPQISWKEKLRMALQFRAGKDESTWSRPHRRRIAMPPHLYMPGVTGHQAGHVVVYIDTSGSISDVELNAFMTEICCIAQDTQPELLQVGSFDTEAYAPKDILSPEEVLEYEPEGGGGTHLPSVYPKLEELGIIPDALVLLTDGYTDWGDKPKYPVIVVSTTKQSAPYGDNIRLHLGE